MPPLNAAERGFVKRGDIPLIGLLTALTRWWVDRHFELLAQAGFDDLRPAHNAVVVNLPRKGLRLTELASIAGVSKQAMAELVDDLASKGYLQREPDPADGRAKIITWAARGDAAHTFTLKAFAEIEHEMAAITGKRPMAQMRGSLQELFARLVLAHEP